MKKIFPNLVFSILLCLLFLALQAASALSIVLGSIGLVVLLGTTLPAAAIISLCSSINRTPFFEAMGWGKVRESKIVYLLAMTVSLSLLVSEADNVVSQYLVPPSFYDTFIFELKTLFPEGSRFDFTLSALSVMLVAPLMEEGVFRGALFRGIASQLGAAAGIIASSLLFMLVHINPVQFVGAFCLGIVYATLIMRGYNTADTFLAHAVHNTISMVFLFGLIELPGMSIPNGETIEHVPLWIIGVSLFVFISSFVVLMRDEKPFTRNREAP